MKHGVSAVLSLGLPASSAAHSCWGQPLNPEAHVWCPCLAPLLLLTPRAELKLQHSLEHSRAGTSNVKPASMLHVRMRACLPTEQDRALAALLSWHVVLQDEVEGKPARLVPDGVADCQPASMPPYVLLGGAAAAHPGGSTCGSVHGQAASRASQRRGVPTSAQMSRRSSLAGSHDYHGAATVKDTLAGPHCAVWNFGRCQAGCLPTPKRGTPSWAW